MTILTKYGLQKALEEGAVVITPPPKLEHIGPNSIDLHLAPEMLRYNRVRRAPGDYAELDVREETPTYELHIPNEGMVLYPGKLYLGRTVERTNTPHHVPYIGGRSSVGRLGISIHCTAGFGDVGFDGTWTLEITAVQPVRIYAGMRIAQLWLFECSEQLRDEDKYHGRYQGQIEPTASRFAQKDGE